MSQETSFNELPKEQQDKLIQQAQYLIDKGYELNADDPLKLAEIIFERQQLVNGV